MFTILPMIVGLQVIGPANNPPSIPQNVQAQDFVSYIRVNWQASTDDVAVMGYSIDKQITGDLTWETLGVVNSSTLFYDDYSIISPNTYSYRVRAYDEENEFSGFSTVVNITI